MEQVENKTEICELEGEFFMMLIFMMAMKDWIKQEDVDKILEGGIK